MGNENIHMLTRSNDYELRIELEDFEGGRASVIIYDFQFIYQIDYLSNKVLYFLFLKIHFNFN